MKNDKITICFTDPNTGKEIKTDCTERSDISLDYIREQSDAIYQGLIPEYKDISFTTSVKYSDNRLKDYFKVLYAMEYLRQQKSKKTE